MKIIVQKQKNDREKDLETERVQFVFPFTILFSRDWNDKI